MTTIAAAPPPPVLIAVTRDRTLASALEANGYGVVLPPTGTRALEWARDIRPDLIVLEGELPDMSALEACRLFRADPHVGRSVPILLLTTGRPTPEQRVSALRAGAWDFLRYPGDLDELSLQLQAYVQAKRNIDAALADGLVDPLTGLHTRPGLARRARELGALMARHHSALACVVFDVEAEAADPRAGTLVQHAARLSDVVGTLGPSEFAVLAPATDETGAVKLAERVAGALRAAAGGGSLHAHGSTLHVGYDAVSNLKYSPIDPVALLARAAAAVRNGKPEPGYLWVRRFDANAAAEPASMAKSRITPPGLVLDTRRSG